jgi:hypothetical protein
MRYSRSLLIGVLGRCPKGTLSGAAGLETGFPCRARLPGPRFPRAFWATSRKALLRVRCMSKRAASAQRVARRITRLTASGPTWRVLQDYPRSADVHPHRVRRGGPFFRPGASASDTTTVESTGSLRLANSRRSFALLFVQGPLRARAQLSPPIAREKLYAVSCSRRRARRA